jgi:hypothetical protein
MTLNVVYNLARGDPVHAQDPCGVDLIPGFNPPRISVGFGVGRRDTQTVAACSAVRSPESAATLTTSIR